jgi:hypothetical protein
MRHKKKKEILDDNLRRFGDWSLFIKNQQIINPSEEEIYLTLTELLTNDSIHFTSGLRKVLVKRNSYLPNEYNLKIIPDLDDGHFRNWINDIIIQEEINIIKDGLDLKKSDSVNLLTLITETTAFG